MAKTNNWHIKYYNYRGKNKKTFYTKRRKKHCSWLVNRRDSGIRVKISKCIPARHTQICQLSYFFFFFLFLLNIIFRIKDSLFFLWRLISILNSQQVGRLLVQRSDKFKLSATKTKIVITKFLKFSVKV